MAIKLPKKPDRLERLGDVKTYIAQSKTATKKKTWAQMVAEVIQIGDERGVPASFSANFRLHLYGEQLTP